MLNTVKTILGFLATLITRYTPLDLSENSLEGIFNFLPISQSVFTSGQPTEAQFKLIKQAGFQRVINLAPHGVENALADEAGTLHALELLYVHIPVDFGNPTEDDFTQFCAAMEKAEGEHTWVHCAANMRVSAFLFRYRRDILGNDPQRAEQDLHRIWKPSGVWKRFLAL